MVDQPSGGSRVKVRLRAFSNSLPMNLLLAREAVMARFRPGLHMYNVSEQQWRVLRALTAVDEIEVTALANATFLLAPSLSRILKDLEARGLVTRRTTDGDLRKSLIAISADGIKVIEAVAPYSERIYEEITRTYGPEKLAELQKLLRELAQITASLPAVEIIENMPEDMADIFKARRRGRPRAQEDLRDPEAE